MGSYDFSGGVFYPGHGGYKIGNEWQRVVSAQTQAKIQEVVRRDLRTQDGKWIQKDVKSLHRRVKNQEKGTLLRGVVLEEEDRRGRWASKRMVWVNPGAAFIFCLGGQEILSFPHSVKGDVEFLSAINLASSQALNSLTETMKCTSIMALLYCMLSSLFLY